MTIKKNVHRSCFVDIPRPFATVAEGPCSGTYIYEVYLNGGNVWLISIARCVGVPFCEELEPAHTDTATSQAVMHVIQ